MTLIIAALAVLAAYGLLGDRGTPADQEPAVRPVTD
jgi:hypothetical protein